MLPTKKTLSLPLLIATFALLFTACDDSSTGPESGGEESQLETHTVADFPADTASTGEITYYSLRENSVVEDSASTQWDIAFSGTTIYTNSEASGPGAGGAILLDQSFDATTIAPPTGYSVDTSATNLAIPTGDENGWYNYTGQTGTPSHTIIPLENKTIVLKTADGQHYAKIRILSYYKGNPEISDERPADSRNYTFEYAIQLNGSRELQ